VCVLFAFINFWFIWIEFKDGSFLEIGNQVTPAEARRYAISQIQEESQIPQERSKHTGFAFDSLGYESFFAA
jgi:hypothetical protein